MEWVPYLIAVAVVLPIFFLPSIIAFRRRHRRKWPILAVNLISTGAPLWVLWPFLLWVAVRGAGETTQAQSEDLQRRLYSHGRATPGAAFFSDPGDELSHERRHRTLESSIPATSGPRDLFDLLTAYRRLEEFVKIEMSAEPSGYRYLTTRTLELLTEADRITTTQAERVERLERHRERIVEGLEHALTPGTVCLAEVAFADGEGAKDRPVVVLSHDLETRTVHGLRSSSQEHRAGRPEWVEVDRYGWDTPKEIREREELLGESLKGKYDRTLYGRSFIDVAEPLTVNFSDIKKGLGQLDEGVFREIQRARHRWENPPRLGDQVEVDEFSVRVLDWSVAPLDGDARNALLSVELEVSNIGKRPKGFDPAASTVFLRGGVLYEATWETEKKLNPGVTLNTTLQFLVPTGTSVSGGKLILRCGEDTIGVVTRPFGP